MSEVEVLRAEIEELRRVQGLLLEMVHGISVRLAQPKGDFDRNLAEVWKQHIADKRQKLEAGNLGAG